MNIHVAIATLLAMLGVLGGFLLLRISERDLMARIHAQSANRDRARALRHYERLAVHLVASLHPRIAGQGAEDVERFTTTCRDLNRCAAGLGALFGGQFVVRQQLADLHHQLDHWLGEVIAVLGKRETPERNSELAARYDALRRTMQSLEQSVRQIEQRLEGEGANSIELGVTGLNETASGVAAVVIMSVLVIWCWSIGVVRRGLRAMEGALLDVVRGSHDPTLDPSRLPIEFRPVVDAYHNVCGHLMEKSARHARDMEKLNEQLLKGLITICSSCKKIKVERGQWVPVEAYVRSRTTAEFTHALCEECLNKTLDTL